MPGSEGIRAGCPVWGSPGNRAIAAPQQPALVDIIEIVTLHDGREILPFRLHLAHPAAPWGDPQISGLEWAQDDFTPVSVKPFFDLMRCHPHDPTSFLQGNHPSQSKPVDLETLDSKIILFRNQRKTDHKDAEKQKGIFTIRHV